MKASELRRNKSHIHRVLDGEELPIKIVFKNMFGIEYPLENLERCENTETLKYVEKNIVLNQPNVPLEIYVNGLNLGRYYSVGNIALTLEKFKKELTGIQREASDSLRRALGAGSSTDLYNRPCAIIINNLSIELRDEYNEDLYVKIRKLADDIFIGEATRIREFLKSSVRHPG